MCNCTQACISTLIKYSFNRKYHHHQYTANAILPRQRSMNQGVVATNNKQMIVAELNYNPILNISDVCIFLVFLF